MTHFATRADLAALEARLTWRFAGAMVAHALTMIGAMIAIVRLLGRQHPWAAIEAVYKRARRINARSKQPVYFGKARKAK